MQEVTYGENPQVVFDLACFDYTNKAAGYLGTAGYRSHRIPDLYGHAPRAVTDLNLSFENDQPRLDFSGDPTRSYSVEALSDLMDWTEIETISAGTLEDSGEFTVYDVTSAGVSARYYRVITH